jgi:glucose/arabinose dehydrogenase
MFPRPFLVAGAAAAASTAIAAIPPIALKPVVVNQFDSPTAIAHAGDGSGRLFVCEQRGQIRIVRDGMLLPAPFLDLSPSLVPERANFDERGLLGLAFHPGFATPASPGFRRFYVFYSAVSPNPGTPTEPVNCRSTVAEFRVSETNPDAADPSTERILLGFDKPQFNHNGGQIEFGPDALLYIATGDGGGSNDNDPGHTGGAAPKPESNFGNAQDRRVLHGKILRIDPLGTDGPGGQFGVPPTNPFVGQIQDLEGTDLDGPIRGEIFAYGLRNPWRFSFDPPTGRLFCADLGQGRVEEVDLIVAGGNYGWRAKEGTADFDPAVVPGGLPLIPPIAEYAHLETVVGTPPLPQIGASITGGYVYRGSRFPELVGKYIFADWGPSTSVPSGTLLGLEEIEPDAWQLSVLDVTGLNPVPLHFPTFGRDETGEIYVATKLTQAPSQPGPITGQPTGSLYRIVPGTAATAATATLTPVKDNTMFSENQNSSGRGFLFAGRTASTAASVRRRALMAFDLAALPNGALIESARLTLRMNRTISGASNVSLFRALEEWGEGASNAGDPGGQGTAPQPGDATWANRIFPGTPWTTPGGHFAGTASATTSVGEAAAYAWSTAAMAAEVQAWRDNPLVNFGWVLVGDESKTSAKRFASREDPQPSVRPSLAIEYVFAPPATRWEEWLHQFFPIGQYVDTLSDLDGDAMPVLIEYAMNHSPLTANPPALTPAPDPDGSALVVTFRRDPRATDLTCRLEAGTDLDAWESVVESVAGAAPTGTALVSDSPIAAEPPMRLVTARQPLPQGGNHVFLRLVLLRDEVAAE